MPFIKWTSLPQGVKNHLLDRLRLRGIGVHEMTALLEWVRTDPEVPDGPWCKDFGKFKLAGHGALPTTFLDKEQPCVGQQI